MSRVVLDANVVLKWFGAHDEPGGAEALALRGAFQRGEIDVVVPHLLDLEILNVAGRRWGWPAADLAELAAALGDVPWTYREPALADVARWVARGLTAYDATYLALAEATACSVVTADEAMLAVPGTPATPLVPS